jgi:hypothetical protein
MSLPELRIRWAAKVRPEKIWRLYQQDARGLVDEELIEEIGWALYQRCQSILWVTDRSCVSCPRCHHVIVCPGERWSRRCPIHCPECSRQATYGQWRDSWRHQDLWGGNAMPAFRAFVAAWERATAPRERMLLIDRLIHAFHWSLRQNRPFGPAVRNLIEGRYDEVVAFLERLTYGEGSTPGTPERKVEWRGLKERVEAAQQDWWRRPDTPEESR